MAAPTNIWYSNIGAVQAGGVNVLANLNDPNLTFSRLKLITAIYTMTGNELANDVIYIARLPSGAIVDPTNSTIAPQAIATTATLSVGDTDTQGGTVAYDPARYSAAVDIHANNTTTGVTFSNGTTLTNPPTNPIASASLSTLTGAAATSYGITDDWVWLVGTFATLGTPVSGKQIVFRVQVASLD